MARKGEGKGDSGDLKTTGKNNFKTKKSCSRVSMMSKFIVNIKGKASVVFTLLGTLHVVAHLILITSICCYYPHVTDETVDTQVKSSALHDKTKIHTRTV